MNYLYVCNWKMYLNRDEQEQFLNYFVLLTKTLPHSLEFVMCPPSIHLAMANEKLYQNRKQWPLKIALGAQDCSQFAKGPYTGEISASYLKEFNCSYCIIGHAERRLYGKEDDEIVLRKAANLVQQDIKPIICVGGMQAETTAALCHLVEQQILFYAQGLLPYQLDTILFAYEPVAAIGTGMLPTMQDIALVIGAIKQVARQAFLESNVMVLYGGSVDENSIVKLKKIVQIDGFLLGRASTDLGKLEKTILAQEKQKDVAF